MINYITSSTILIKFDNIVTPSIESLIRDLEFSGSSIIYLDIETTGLHPRYDIPLLLGLMLDEVYYIVDLITVPKSDIIKLLYTINDQYKVVAHNAGFDLSVLYYHFEVLFDNVWCTQVADQVLFNGVDSYKFGYSDLVLRYAHKHLDKSAVESFIERDPSLPFTLTEIIYLVNDLKYLPVIRNKQLLGIHKKELSNTIGLEMDFLPKKVKMESYGVSIDSAAWLKLAKENKEILINTDNQMRKELLKLDKQFDFTSSLEMFSCSAQMDLFNPNVKTIQEINIGLVNFNSPKQLMEVLNSCNGKFLETGIDILQQKLRDNKDAPYAAFLLLLIKYRGYQKLVSTYGETFLKRMDRITGKLHTSFTQAFTTTGRLSSASYKVAKGVVEGVNLQNVKADKKYRNCFIAEFNRSLVTADYGGQEIALAGYQSKDPLLLSAVEDGLDLHSKLAQGSFRIITGDDTLLVSKEINPAYRKIHKNVLFALFYGAGPPRIADTLNISIDLAEKVYRNLRKLLYKLMEYQDKIKADLLNTSSVRDHSFTNRVRYFEKLFNQQMSLHKAEKEASNFPIQSSGASMVKLAIIMLDNHFVSQNLDAKVLFTVHDEIIVDIPKHSGLQTIITDIMKEAASKFVGDLPIKVDAQTLSHWTK